MYDKKIFADNLKKFMQKDNRNQTDIMRITGASQSAVSDWINARKFPRVDKIEMLANYFGVKKSDLIEEKTDLSGLEIYLDLISKNESVRLLLDLIRTMPKDDINALLSIAKRFKK